MAYENDTLSSVYLTDLISKLLTFAVANGWTQDENDTGNGHIGFHKNSVYVSMAYEVASPANLGIYQALAWDGAGTDPGNHTDDSGNGAIGSTNSVLDDGRYMPSLNLAREYWFFENDSSPAYIHVVIKYSDDSYRYFGFGELVNFGDNWTGGEYVFGDKKVTAGASNAIDTDDSRLLDGIADSATIRPYCATVHMEGIPGQVASSKWGVVWGDGQTSQGNDRGATGRNFVQGGFRGGPFAKQLGRYSAGTATGLVPMYPIVLIAKVGTSLYRLGEMSDVRGINTEHFSDEEEFTYDGDTWVAFPSCVRGTATGVGATRNQGVAFKKVTA